MTSARWYPRRKCGSNAPQAVGLAPTRPVCPSGVHRRIVHPQLNIATAFLAGLLSFVSPCVLPLIPAYLSFLTGSSLEELKAGHNAAQRARVLFHALAFSAGFTLIFMLLGLSASAVGSAF